jgi:membrane protein
VSAVLTALGTILATLSGGVLLWSIVSAIINVFVLMLIFALLLKYLPQTNVAWGDVWLGAALTAVLWILLQNAIAFYIALSSYRNYGAIGAMYAQQYGSRRGNGSKQ